MSKTVDELIAAYNAAYHSSHDDQHRAGIAAVVRALRDELSKCDWDEGENMIDALDKILDDAGNDAARKSYWDKHYGVDEPTAPATDPCPRCGHPAQDQCDSPDCNTVPAPAVCEWKRISEFDTVVHYSTPHGVMNDLHLWRGLQCSACHAPIKFTEAK